MVFMLNLRHNLKLISISQEMEVYLEEIVNIYSVLIEKN